MKTKRKDQTKISKWQDVLVDPETGEISEAHSETKAKTKARAEPKAKAKPQTMYKSGVTEDQSAYEIPADAFIKRIREKAPLVGVAAEVLRQRGVEIKPITAKSEWVLDMEMIKRLLSSKANKNGLYLQELKEINAHFINHKLQEDGGVNEQQWIIERADTCFNSVIGNALSYVAKRLTEDQALEWDEELTRYNASFPESLYLPQQRIDGEYTRVSMLSLAEPLITSPFGDSTGIFGDSPYPEDTEDARLNMFNHERKGKT